MAIPNRQIGWSQESNLLYEILRQLDQLTKVTSTGGGGGVNPTSTVIPFNNAGVFADSYLTNDSVGSVLKTVYSGQDVGMFFDFINYRFTIGDPNNLINGTYITVDDFMETVQIRSGNATTWQLDGTSITSQVKTGYGEDNISLAFSDYVIEVPGVYSVTVDGGEKLTIPDPAIWPGQSITIINQTISSILYNGGTVMDAGTASILSDFAANSMYTLYSTGGSWYAGKYA